MVGSVPHPVLLAPTPVAGLSMAELAVQAKALMRTVDAARYDWARHARPSQREPRDYLVHAIVAGRGAGKTRTGAETVRRWAKRRVGTYAVIAKNDREVRRICFEAPKAGLLAVIPPADVAGYRKGSGETELTLTNGSRIMAFSGETPDNLRGYAFDGVWVDEFGVFGKNTAQDTWDNMMFCLREAVDPHVIVTTTPKNVPHIKTLMSRCGTDPGWVLTRGRTEENRANLSPLMLAELKRAYAGTRLGRQELDGELLEDVENALWDLALIAAATWRFDAYGPLPELVETVTAVDPSGSEKGDATGIVTLARGKPIVHTPLDVPAPAVAGGVPVAGGPILVLADDTTQGTPEHRYATACLAAHRHGAGVILMENAYGGDNVFMGIRSSWADLVRRGTIPATVPLPRLLVAPTKGKSKADRAQPVVGLYEQTASGGERIFHASVNGSLAALEDEQTSWEPGSTWSPNRLDALVHGARHLMRAAGDAGSVGSATGLRPTGRAGGMGRRRAVAIPDQRMAVGAGGVAGRGGGRGRAVAGCGRRAAARRCPGRPLVGPRWAGDRSAPTHR